MTNADKKRSRSVLTVDQQFALADWMRSNRETILEKRPSYKSSQGGSRKTLDGT